MTKDPAQKEKDECNKWMQDSLDALSRHIEQNEAEIECLENKKAAFKRAQLCLCVRLTELNKKHTVLRIHITNDLGGQNVCC